MRKHTLNAIAMLSLLLALATVSVHAQSTNNIIVTVPFDFKVAGKMLPAGEYIVRRSTLDSTEGLLIQRRDSRAGAGAFVLTKSIQAGAKQEDSKLVFHRYGTQYFLSQVWTSGYGRELFMSGKERSLERGLAKNGEVRQTVAVISRQQ